jgi:hypothetical protein
VLKIYEAARIARDRSIHLPGTVSRATQEGDSKGVRLFTQRMRTRKGEAKMSREKSIKGGEVESYKVAFKTSVYH